MGGKRQQPQFTSRGKVVVPLGEKKKVVKHPVEELHLDVAKASLEEPQREGCSTITFILAKKCANLNCF